MVDRLKARLRLVLALLLVAVTAAVYAPALENGFVWDDDEIVVRDPAVRDLRHLRTVVLSADEMPPYYRPLTRASFVVEWAAFGADPRPFHAISLGLHAVNVVLVFCLALGLLGHVWPAFAAALLFALHPINAEAVNFISGRNNLLALACMVASLLAFRRALTSGTRVWAWIAAVCLFLALGAKEPAITVVPLLLVLLAAERSGPKGRLTAADLTWLAPAGFAVVAYLALRWVALDGLLGVVDPLAGLPGRIMAALAIVPRYLWLVVWPADLTVFHEAPLAGELLSATALVPWLALVAAVGIVVRRPSNASAFGLLWFGLNLLPILNIVPIPSATLAERYVYVPAVGLWILAADFASRLGWILNRPRAVAVALGLLMALLAFRTVDRTRQWKTDVTLFEAAVDADPTSAVARFNLGTALREAGALAAARQRWTEAIALDPHHAGALTQLGTAAAAAGRFAEAEMFYARALASRPGFAIAHFNMARLLEKTGRGAEAERHYEAFLAGAPARYKNLVDQAREGLAGAHAVGRPR
jgi:tetratricopeptide (TPR) repeat protein